MLLDKYHTVPSNPRPNSNDPEAHVSDLKFGNNDPKLNDQGNRLGNNGPKVDNGGTKLVKWWQKRKYIGVLLFIVVLITLGIGVWLGSLACGCTNTGEYVPVPTPSPTTAHLHNTNTVPTPLTLEEQYELQEEELYNLSECQLVDVSIRVMDVLYKRPEDSLLDENILTRYVRVPRCQGFCGRGDCLAVHMDDEDFVVKYSDYNETIQYVKRKVMHHKLCRCEGK